MMREVWHRIEDYRQWITETETIVCLRHDRFPVRKHTRCGVSLNVYGRSKFVLKDARKRWASPTKEEAPASFVARKKRQIGILSSQLRDTKIALEMATADPVQYEQELEMECELEDVG